VLSDTLIVSSFFFVVKSWEFISGCFIIILSSLYDLIFFCIDTITY
jgi:hypothetical protein